jgi:hypothetical protein
MYINIFLYNKLYSVHRIVLIIVRNLFTLIYFNIPKRMYGQNIIKLNTYL